MGKIEDNDFRTQRFKAEIRENYGFRLRPAEDEVKHQIVTIHCPDSIQA